MINGNLKKLATQQGLKIAGGVAYGSLRGYAVTLSQDSSTIHLVVSTTFPDPAQKSQLESYLNQQNLSKEYRVQALTFGETFIKVLFPNAMGVVKKLERFLDFFFPALGNYGVTGAEICTSCGAPLAGDSHWILLDDTARCLHDGCAQQLRQSVAGQNADRRANDNGSYFWGILGALLGAAVGAVLWAVVQEMGYYSALVGLAIGLLANVGYNLLHGKQTKAKVAILLLAVIFGVLLGIFMADFYEVTTVIKDGTLTGLSYGDIPSLLLFMAQTDSEYLSNVILRIVMGLVFAGLGVFSLLRQTSKEVSDRKLIDLP